MTSAPKGNLNNYVHPDGYAVHIHHLPEMGSHPRIYSIVVDGEYVGQAWRWRTGHSIWRVAPPDSDLTPDEFTSRADAIDWLIKEDQGGNP